MVLLAKQSPVPKVIHDKSGFGTLAVAAKQCSDLGLKCISERSCDGVRGVDVRNGRDQLSLSRRCFACFQRLSSGLYVLSNSQFLESLCGE